MAYFGEIISLTVAALWTVAAMAAEVAAKRQGVFVVNVWRMVLTLVFCSLLLWATTGQPLPLMAGREAWCWLLLSGFVGYFLGDWCLYNSYIVMGSRMGQLFMTLAPAFAAFSAWVMIGQTLSWHSLLAMGVTLLGIAVAITDKMGTGTGSRVTLKGVLFGLGAALGQGLGLVLGKIGIDHFTANLSAQELEAVGSVLPFASNLIRCVAGAICFSAWYAVGQKARRQPVVAPLAGMFSDRKASLALLATLLSGPFVGVALSLLAVQHTAAGIASTLMATTAILILLPSRWFFHQPLTPRAVLGTVLSFVGVSLFFLL